MPFTKLEDPGQPFHPEGGALGDASTNTSDQYPHWQHERVRNQDTVQLTAQLRGAYSRTLLSALEKTIFENAFSVGTNGSSRSVAMYNNTVRRPYGDQPDGTDTLFYPSIIVPLVHAPEMDEKFKTTLGKFAKDHEGVEFLGLIRSAREAIYAMDMGLGSPTTNEKNGTLVELNYATPATNNEQEEGDRNDVGAEASQA